MSGVVAACTAIAQGGFSFTINGTGTYLPIDVRQAAIAEGWDGVAAVVCTLTGVFHYKGGYSTGAALAVTGIFPNGVTIINQAVIDSNGGNGGQGGGSGGAATEGAAGGIALYVDVPCVFDNQGELRGGGGGGGGAGQIGSFPGVVYGGGGGGGGQGGGPASVPGVGANRSYGGQGGTGDYPGYNGNSGGVEGAGAGSSGPSSNGRGGDGGSWGAAGATGASGASGGPGGYAVYGNSYITWINTGTRIGAIT